MRYERRVMRTGENRERGKQRCWVSLRSKEVTGYRKQGTEEIWFRCAQHQPTRGLLNIGSLVETCYTYSEGIDRCGVQLAEFYCAFRKIGNGKATVVLGKDKSG
jgi:hypothetical protein